MRPLASLTACLAVAAGAATAFVALAAPTAAETGVSVSDVCTDGGQASPRINLLILLDTSRSLRTTDPGNLRSAGTREALRIVEDLSRIYPDSRIEVTLDTFDERYSRQEGWHPADQIFGRVGDSIETIASDAGLFTDYRAALSGAWERFATRANDCNLLIWFTDGQHATAADDEGEQNELVELCRSPVMRSLHDQVWVGAVQLTEGDTAASRLRYLYGEEGPGASSQACTNQLRGRIYDSFETSELSRVLRELIERSIGGSGGPAEPGTPEAVLPPPEVFEGCDGDGSPETPCVYMFTLEPGIESFRAFVDRTLIERGIQNPESVLVAVRAPDGTISPSIGGRGDIRPGEDPTRYVQINPFGFFARSNFPSDLQIVGHQVAQQLAHTDFWSWQWEGEWALLFFGESPAAQADARRAAAAVRVQRDDSPFIDSFGIDDQCSVTGFVANHPSEDYAKVELRLRVDAGDGGPVYPTRTSLTEASIGIEEGNRRFTIPRFFTELVTWDSPEQGGNGTNLRTALTQRDGVALAAVLSQTLPYPYDPDPEARGPLVWMRDIGRLELTQRQADHLSGLIDGGVGDPLLCLPVDPGIRWLPTEVHLGDSQDGWSRASFQVSASPGALPGTLSLAAEGATMAEGSETGVAAFSGVEISHAEWSCEVPAAAGESSRFPCPEPVTIEVGTDRPLRPTVQLRIPLTVTESPGSAGRLLERLGYEADSEGYGARAEALAEALSRERRTETLAAELDPVIDPAANWLPSDFQMEATEPPDAIDIKSILVSASPGELPARVDLESVRLVPVPGRESRDATSADVSGWACEIPGLQDGRGRFACADPITVDIPSDRDVELSLVPTLCPSEAPGAVKEMLERSGVPEVAPGFEALKLQISEALDLERSCTEASTALPPTPDSTLLKFLPMLAALIAAAAAARALIAWRLRPWQPLGSSDYSVLPLDSSDVDGVSPPAPDPSQICMDLQQHKPVTNIEGLRLRSLWMPLLRGSAPRINASSPSGDCIGPDGHTHPRRGRVEAVVGPDLVRGWIVHDTGDDPSLIVWDLPFGDDETRRARIIDAARDAARAWEQFQGSAATDAPVLGDSETVGVATTGVDLTAQELTEPDPALQDPFFDDADHRPGDDGQDLDDPDPFGREN